MRRILLFLIPLFMAFCSCSHGGNGSEEAQTEGIDTVPMLIMQVQKCSRLYTAEFKIHKIVTHDDVVRLKGTVFSKQFDFRMPIGDRKIAIPMDVTLKAYIDFSAFSEQNVRRAGERITIVLPDPRVVLTGSHIDQKGVKEYVALTRSRFTDAEMADFERQGRASIIASLPRMSIVETARVNAAQLLIPILEQMGYHEKDITITFRKDFTDADFRTILDMTGVEGQ